MTANNVAVLDIGKTNAKLTLCDARGHRLVHRSRLCQSLAAGAYPTLDTDGLATWVATILKEFALRGPIDAIVPVGHGAAFALVQKGKLACPVPDYETPIPAAVRQEYDSLRDPFSASGSPRLPNGLNLGAQIYRLESTRPGLLSVDTQILTWPQYWAWRLCGVAAAEVTSLGCHTDLWLPSQGQPSGLARSRGWDARLAPRHKANEVLGVLSPEWQARTGLGQTKVYCGIHDSNASLLAARGFTEIADHEATVVSTGTWFVALRSPGPQAQVNLQALPEDRDCLVNVDLHGKPVPSARFMGGREIAMLGGIAEDGDQKALLSALPYVVQSEVMVMPSWSPGVGPYPRGMRRWIGEPRSPAERKAAVSLYAALVVDTALELIGATERVLIEGRFAQAEVFARVLAALRPDIDFFTSTEYDGIAIGAQRLVNPDLRPPIALKRVEGLGSDLTRYKAAWRSEAQMTSAGL